MLLGYRYNGNVPGSRNREDLPLLDAVRTSSPVSNTVSDDTNHPDDEGEEDEDVSGEYRPYGAGSGQRLRKTPMIVHVPLN